MDNQEILSVKQRFGIIGNAPALNYAINVAMQVAATDLTVLITGESGSGKESFSKIIHSLSARKHGQFIAINCGAIPEGTIDSEDPEIIFFTDEVEEAVAHLERHAVRQFNLRRQPLPKRSAILGEKGLGKA